MKVELSWVCFVLGVLVWRLQECMRYLRSMHIVGILILLCYLCGSACINDFSLLYCKCPTLFEGHLLVLWDDVGSGKYCAEIWGAGNEFMSMWPACVGIVNGPLGHEGWMAFFGFCFYVLIGIWFRFVQGQECVMGMRPCIRLCINYIHFLWV